MTARAAKAARKAKAKAAVPPTEQDLLQFDDNSLLPLLYGEHDQNLARIERQLGVSLASRGNRIAVSGPDDSVKSAAIALNALYERLRKGMAVGDSPADVASKSDVIFSISLSRIFNSWGFSV